MRTLLTLLVLGAAFTFTACASNYDGTYCQSGPKYGTQCYTMVPQPGTGVAPPPPGTRTPVEESRSVR